MRGRSAKPLAMIGFLAGLLLFRGGSQVSAVQEPGSGRLPNLDRRPARIGAAALEEARRPAVARLRQRWPDLQVEADRLSGAPKWVARRGGYLSDRPGLGGRHDAAAVATAFLEQQADLYGHGAEIFKAARARREYQSRHNGLRTAVWQQELEGIPVFEAVLVAHLTGEGQLVALASLCLPDLEKAAEAGGRGRGSGRRKARCTAAEAVVRAAAGLEGVLAPERVVAAGPESSGPERRQRFRAGHWPDEAEAELVWLPISRAELRLCWQVDLTRPAGGERFRLLIDADTGELMLRRCLTLYLTEATYRVFRGDSPSPFTPGHAVPSAEQPPLVTPTRLRMAAWNTNASLLGWVRDGENETAGNNVEAHLDRDADNRPDRPRPQGDPFRVFDFPLNLAEPPQPYGDAAVLHLFYWCNWMHDRLYELGFDEAAGNFQRDNFGRGGLGNDPVLADAQDGAGWNNANFTPARDGQSPRIQMFLFDGPDPDRDPDLDAEVILHEYAHGLIDRLVGDGIGFSVDHSSGMAEGWADFYALALLSEPSDDPDAVYPYGGYSARDFGGLQENYYFGIRRYPYSTDLSKNPLTLKDIHPGQASLHPGVPRSPVANGQADEVHRQGEVWCVALWEARARLIHKYGFAEGNPLMLRLVTDGMRLLPPNPNFLQGRDAILLADRINNHGANQDLLWAAFAKRGLGVSAWLTTFSDCLPILCQSLDVQEAFDLPDPLRVTPEDPVTVSGPPGGPFAPATLFFTLVNRGGHDIPWEAASGAGWLRLPVSNGLVQAGITLQVPVMIDVAAAGLGPGNYPAAISFADRLTGKSVLREVRLRVGQQDTLTELFRGADHDLDGWSVTFTPDLSPSFYGVCRQRAMRFPTDPEGGTAVSLGDDDYAAVQLGDGAEISLYGWHASSFYIGSNGDLCLEPGPTNHFGATVTNDLRRALWQYFAQARVAGYYTDLNPAAGGEVSWKPLEDRVAVTYLGVPAFAASDPNSFQVEAFYDGRIRITHLGVSHRTGIVGLSDGRGAESLTGFAESDLGGAAACLPTLSLAGPAAGMEGEGTLPGRVSLPQPAAVACQVRLSSSNPAELVVPVSVVIPAGESGADFEMAIQDDTELDGSVPVKIWAESDGWGAGCQEIVVQDNEQAFLTLSIPATTREGESILPGAGSVWLSAAPDRPVTVELQSSDLREMQVPAAVTIPAGAREARFDLTIVDDGRIDGTSVVVVRAEVANWPGDLDAILVEDNEETNLVVRLPEDVVEGDGVLTNAGLIEIDGTLPSDLGVILQSDQPGILTTAGTVTIPAGTRSVHFDLMVQDNAATGEARQVTVRAQAAGLGASGAKVTVLDDESPFPPMHPMPAHLAEENLTDVDLRWETLGPGGSGATYAVYFGTNPRPGDAEFLGSSAAPVWQLPVLEPDTSYYWQIVVRKNGREVTGPVWQFRTVGVNFFHWNDLSRPLRVNVPFSVRLEAKDARNITVAGYDEAAELSAWTPKVGASRIVISEVAPSRHDRVEFLNVSGEIIHLLGWRIYLYDHTSWPRPQQVYTITDPGAISAPGALFQLANVLLPSLSSGYPFFLMETEVHWEEGLGTDPIAVLIQDSEGKIVDFMCARGAVAADLTEPAPINTSQWKGGAIAGSTAQGASYQRTGRADHNSRADWLVGTPSLGQVNWGFGEHSYGAQPLACAPAATAPFLQGIWEGEVTLRELAGEVYFRAENAAGRFGESTVKRIELEDDLSLRMTSSAGRVAPLGAFSYFLTLSNAGPSAAVGVVVTNRLPAGLVLESALASLGACVPTNGQVVCAVGTVPGSSTVFIQLTVRGTGAGMVTNTATIFSEKPDLNPENNRATLVTVLGEPFITMTSAAFDEGNAGTNWRTVAVRLSGPSPLPVSVGFATRDGAAQSGRDYLAGSGVVIFPPGTTNVVIPVAIIGDLNDEDHERFSLELGEATNGMVAGARGWILIKDEDGASLSVSNTVVPEGDGGTNTALFDVSLFPASEREVVVNYFATNGSAAAGLDYAPVEGRLAFPPGVTTRQIAVPVRGDSFLEPDETFVVKLISPVNATVSGQTGVATITDDDAGRLDHFDWSSLASPQTRGVPWRVTITARNARGEIVRDFRGPVSLRASANRETRQVGQGLLEWDYPFGARWHDQRVQTIYRAEEIGRAGRISALALDVAADPGQVLNGWTIRMKHTGLERYEAPAWETGGWTVVHRGDSTVTTSGWVTFPLSIPFDYNGVDHLVVDLSFDNSSFSASGRARSFLASDLRTLCFQTDSAFGDPLAWSDTTAPPPSRTARVPNIRLTLEQPGTLIPAVSGTFEEGVWTSLVQVNEVGTHVVLQAWDEAGRSGVSAPILVVLPDADGDGMPDEWELANALNPNDPSDGPVDADDDGLSNLEEYQAGSDPLSAASTVRITRFEVADGDVHFWFTTVTGKLYRVEWTGNLHEAEWRLVFAGLPGTGEPVEVVDRGGGGLPMRIYRVVVLP